MNITRSFNERKTNTIIINIIQEIFGQNGERNFIIKAEENIFQVGQALSPNEMDAWRDFFVKTFGTTPEEHWVFGGRRFSPWHQGIDRFNPFIANTIKQRRWFYYLFMFLHLISQEPRYGNEIMDILMEETHGSWVANPGAIYPLLTLLEKESFIEGQWEDPDKRSIRRYSITPLGKKEVELISMIIIPKLTETKSLLESFIQGFSLTSEKTTIQRKYGRSRMKGGGLRKHHQCT